MFLAGTANLSCYQFFFGVDHVVVVLHAEDSLVSPLNLEVAVPGGCLGFLDVESSQASFREGRFQNLSTLAVVNKSKFEAEAWFR